MKARVNDTVHVEIQIIKLLPVRVWFRRIYENFIPVYIHRLVLDDIRDDFRVLDR